MNTIDLAALPALPDLTQPTTLFDDGRHQIYWLGLDEDTSFRCNVYLIVDGDQRILVDPGGRNAFDAVRQRVEQVCPAASVTALVLCHQDPDVAAAMVDWLKLKPGLTVYTSLRTNALLPYFGSTDYEFVDIATAPELSLPSGSSLRFIEAPFLHFAGAITTYDTASGFLFSGDIFAAVGTGWRLVVDNFPSHSVKMDVFHIDYMASNIAIQGFLERLNPYSIRAILPQHGSIIDERFVDDAIDYLADLECGTDVLYPHLS